MPGTPLAPDASLLEVLRAYQARLHRYLDGDQAERASALQHAFAQLQALQRARLPALADAFELLEHLHHRALQDGAADGAARALLRQRNDLVIAECTELLRQLH
jgi:hypothetical protein